MNLDTKVKELLSWESSDAEFVNELEFKDTIGAPLSSLRNELVRLIRSIQCSQSWYLHESDEKPEESQLMSQVLCPTHCRIHYYISKLSKAALLYAFGKIPKDGYGGALRLEKIFMKMVSPLLPGQVARLENATDKLLQLIFEPDLSAMSELEWREGVERYAEDFKRQLSDLWSEFKALEVKIENEAAERKARDQSKKHAYTKGVSEFDGKVARDIWVESGKMIKVKNSEYHFTAGRFWEIANRFLRSISQGDDHSAGHYPVRLTAVDCNGAYGDFAVFLKNCIEREKIHGRGNRHYSDRARLVVG